MGYVDRFSGCRLPNYDVLCHIFFIIPCDFKDLGMLFLCTIKKTYATINETDSKCRLNYEFRLNFIIRFARRR